MALVHINRYDRKFKRKEIDEMISSRGLEGKVIIPEDADVILR